MPPRRLLAGAAAWLVLLAAPAANSVAGAILATRDLLPDAPTALAVARPVLVAPYGAERVADQEPLRIERRAAEWVINGTLRCAPNCVGGTLHMVLAARDARVVTLFHTQ